MGCIQKLAENFLKMNDGENSRLLDTSNETGSLPQVSRSRSSRSKATLNEIKRSIFGNMELGPVDFIFAAVFILNTVSFISKMLSPKEELDMNYNPFGDTPDDVIIT